MRLILEPTTAPILCKGHPRVTIEIPGDDHTLGEIMSDLIRPGLSAWGFAEKTIDSHLPEDP